MTPLELLGPPSAIGAPAPWWLLAGLKVLGFTLHLVPMNLWYAGILIALWLGRSNSAEARHWSRRLLLQMPLFIAAGVNFGIVPLLFLQTSYYRVFYPATILMAWPWLSIIGLLTLAYYGVYVYGMGLKRGSISRLRLAIGWTAGLAFLLIGFVFSNAMSLMTNVPAWPEIARRTGDAGAVYGTALNLADPVLLPRWLMMIGLALTTVAVHAVFDAGLFGGRSGGEYRRWAVGFARKLALAGVVWFALCGSWYVFGAWPAGLRAAMTGGSLAFLTGATALAPGLVLLLLLLRRGPATPGFAALLGATQFLVLGLNAVSRQVVQNLELRPLLDVTAEPMAMQWSPLLLFLVCFVAGVALVIWMVSRVVTAERKAAA